MPESVNSGTKPAMMISAENSTARSTSPIASAMAASLPVSPPGAAMSCERVPGRPSRRGRGKAAEHVLDENDRRVDDEAEVDRADREQVRGLAEQHQQA